MTYTKIVAGLLAALVLITLAALLAAGVNALARPASTVEGQARADMIANAQAQATATAVTLASRVEVAAAASAAGRGELISNALAALVLVVIIAIAAALVLVLAAGVNAYLHRRRPLVQILDIPVSRRHVEAGQYPPAVIGAIAGRATAQIEAARRGGTPASINYAPHDSRRIEAGAAAPAGGLDAATLDAPAFSVPSFGTLMQQGIISAGGDMTFGYAVEGDEVEAGQPVQGGFDTIYTAILAGVSGSGKTTTMRGLACQSALRGARFVMLDRHGASDNVDALANTLAPLAGCNLLPPALTDDSILAALDLVKAILHYRISPAGCTRVERVMVQASGLDADERVMVLADEFTGLMRSPIADDVAATLEAVAQEGRKFGVYGMMLGQIFTAGRAGGTALRDAAASTMVHRMKRQQARLLLPLDLAAQTEGLPAGQCIFYRTNGTYVRLAVPRCTADDVEATARLLGVSNASTAAPAAYQPAASNVITSTARPAGAADKAAASAAGNQRPAAAAGISVEVEGKTVQVPAGDVDKIRRLLAASTSTADILQAVWGIGNGGGNQYKLYSRVLRAIIATLVQPASVEAVEGYSDDDTAAYPVEV